MGNFKNTMTYKRELSFLFYLVVFAQNTDIGLYNRVLEMLLKGAVWEMGIPCSIKALLKAPSFFFAFVPEENTKMSWGIKWREEDEYGGGEVSDRRAEEIVSF